VQDVPGRSGRLEAPAGLLPHALIKAIVEVKILPVFELGSRCREQFFSRLDVPVHRATDIEEEKYFHCIRPLRTDLNVEVAFMCCPLDSAVEIKFLGCARTREFAQAT